MLDEARFGSLERAWTPEESARLEALVLAHASAPAAQGSVWPQIATALGTRRRPWECLREYLARTQRNAKRAAWTEEEDAKLRLIVQTYA